VFGGRREERDVKPCLVVCGAFSVCDCDDLAACFVEVTRHPAANLAKTLRWKRGWGGGVFVGGAVFKGSVLHYLTWEYVQQGMFLCQVMYGSDTSVLNWQQQLGTIVSNCC
jgi:hypothetical protein